MALPTFHFQATLPAARESLEPLGPLVKQILEYSGFSGADSAAIAKQIETAARHGLASPPKGHVTIAFDKDEQRLRISLSAPHLSATAPPKGLMEAVTVDTTRSAPTYRYERRVPEAS